MGVGRSLFLPLFRCGPFHSLLPQITSAWGYNIDQIEPKRSQSPSKCHEYLVCNHDNTFLYHPLYLNFNESISRRGREQQNKERSEERKWGRYCHIVVLYLRASAIFTAPSSPILFFLKLIWSEERRRLSGRGKREGSQNRDKRRLGDIIVVWLY